MNEDQFHKLNKRVSVLLTLVALVVVALVFIVAFMFLFSPHTEVRYIHGDKGEQGATGLQGPAGASIVGEKGLAGKDGVNGSDGNTTVVELPGVKGEQGEKGEPGREVELQKNSDTGDIEWRRTGDSFWQVLLPKCEISDKCEVSSGSTD